MGMWVFLCSEVMFFTGLIGSYIVLRFASPLWPQPSTVLNIPLTAMNTFILICSSVTMVQALSSANRGDLAKMKLFLSLTLLFGAIFISIQGVEYWKLLHEHTTHYPNGFNPHASLFGSVSSRRPVFWISSSAVSCAWPT
jgi:heme/copper-type cytochrome/quinol oxidase subunit 3